MNWIKKNIFLVIGGLVALGLLGAAGWFSFTNKEAVDQVTTELNAQIEEHKRLMNRDPHPNQENIEAAKREQERVAALLDQTRKYFVPAASFPTNFDKESFKAYLETTIYQIERDAENASVALPNNNNYDFTFRTQRGSVVFAPETLAPLATQLAEIKVICDVLFGARVNSLLSLRRVPVAKEDEGATDFLVGKKPVTNAVTGAISTPYEIVFQGFSSELSGVLEGFYKTPSCFVVKNIDVQTNVAAAATTGATPGLSYFQPYTPPEAATPQISMDQMMRMRYGLGPRGSPANRYGGLRPGEGAAPVAPPPTAPVPTAPVRRGPETVLDERPLKVTMFIESIRLPATAAAKAAN